jgi:uncharacterized membrane protein
MGISPTSDKPPPVGAAGVLERNIRALLDRKREEERRRSLQNRIADRITRFSGSMWFVYLHLLAFGAWIVVNLGWTPLPKFDPAFVTLAMVASVEAIFLSTFVLITQNRMAAIADRRADLDLQVSLLAEHEVTRLLTLVQAIAQHMGVGTPHDAELPELSKDVLPEKVLDQMDETERKFDAEATGREMGELK